MTQDGVTIILCCFNSEQRLPTTLKHIADQIEIKDAIIEVILVDNRCTDGTVDLFNKWSQTLTGNFFTRIVREETPGLMAARLCGVRHASHETMIFCDDDNWLSPTYCQIALHTLINNPDVGLAGGNSLAEPECTPPAWFGAISGAWAVGESDYTGYLYGPNAFLRGAGLIIRRSFFIQLIKSDCVFVASGRKGKSLSSGEDSEICLEFQRMGARLWYDSHLALKHWIPRQRLTREYAIQLWTGFGSGTIINDADRVASSPDQTFRNFVRTKWLYQVTRAALSLIFILHTHPAFNKVDPTPSLKYCSLSGRLLAIWSMRLVYEQQIRSKIEWISKTRTLIRKKTAQPR